MLRCKLAEGWARSATDRPRKVRWGEGGMGSLACAWFLLVRLGEVIAALPVRYCRLTARYVYDHQNAATPNKGKTNKNRKNKQHVLEDSYFLFLQVNQVSGLLES